MTKAIQEGAGNQGAGQAVGLPETGVAWPALSADHLQKSLKSRFGHDAFRPNQEEVCLAAANGSDVLLVMPTGSGKSLCYQLPGVLRGCTTLVISPLIALMDDQVTKLRAMGLRAASLHSGHAREVQRQTCVDYARGDLDFLMIAPERLGIPGFLEFLERRKPGIIAVDEAHCISHWGHDFRVDYRLLGEHLPRLRPAPVLAMTATATVRVQNDIEVQLGLCNASKFIRGFRRTNLAIECKEVPRPKRHEFVERLLKKPGRLPAIVYVPTRKEAESLAAALPTEMSAVFYHAGAPAGDRLAAQNAFMENRARVVVATVAFGMGIDKSDIRTVVHTSLPDSVEQYYQEIGRAGRDGKLSRAVLLYSYSDRGLLESFHNRSYPDVDLLQEVLSGITATPSPREELPAFSIFDEEVLNGALRQLHTHGAIVWDLEGRIALNKSKRFKTWKRTYVEQRAHRLGQIDDVLSFARSNECRMNRLVGYFSKAEAKAPGCGICDKCAPADSAAHTYRPLNAIEMLWVKEIFRALRNVDGRSAGKLHRDLFPSGAPTRDHYDRLISAMVAGGVLLEKDDSFEKDGYAVNFTRIFLTASGRSLVPNLQGLLIDDDGIDAPSTSPPSKVKKRRSFGERQSTTGVAAIHPVEEESLDGTLLVNLMAWRKEQSVQRGVPAFMIASNALLTRIATRKPTTIEALCEVKGIGAKARDQYGEQIVSLVLQRQRGT